MSNTDTTTDEQLRIAIAEKLGWTYKDVQNFPGNKTRWWRMPKQQPHESASTDGPPDYLHDPAAALLLVEHMGNAGWEFMLTRFTNGNSWASFHRGDPPECYSGIAPTFPLAVAKAFVAANGITPQP